MSNRTAPRILTTIAVFTMVAAAIGFVVTLCLNAFFFDEYDKYGELPIPGTGSVQLPAGDVAVTFHTVLVGGGGSSLPVPPLKYSITGPGGFDGKLTEDYGGTTIVNNDARVRIGFLHIPTAGSYDVSLDGNVSAYLDPKLAFGKEGGFGNVPWILGAVFVVALVALIVVRMWARRVVRRDVPPPPMPSPNWTPTAVPTEYPPPAATFTASDEGIRVQTLETLARLRDSGALTKDEYEAEKKRVLEGR
jgi:putative oligomerization/nucleic acid binding protein